jgi:hypothetical protein
LSITDWWYCAVQSVSGREVWSRVADLVRAMRKVHPDDIQTAFAKLAISVRRGEEGMMD